MVPTMTTVILFAMIYIFTFKIFYLFIVYTQNFRPPY